MFKKVKEARSRLSVARTALEQAQQGTDEAAIATAQRSYDIAVSDYRTAVADAQAEEVERSAEKRENDVPRAERFRRSVEEAFSNKGVTKYTLSRSITSAVISSGQKNNMASAGVPMTIGDLINPLEMELIYQRLGINVATGVHGDLIWPVLDTAIEVAVAGETQAISDTNVDFSKIQAAPQRLAVSVKVSNKSINDAAFDLDGTVTSQIQAALGRALNKAVIGSTALGKLSGPFAGTNSKRGSVTFAGDYPTYKELLMMKGTIAGKGVRLVGFAYIMNASTYSVLEATPITAGDSRMIIQDGKIAGYPVFVTDDNKIPDGQVNAGSFSYAALNQHDDVHFIIDPYSAAKEDCVIFTLNAEWSLTTLRPEAFCVGKKNG